MNWQIDHLDQLEASEIDCLKKELLIRIRQADKRKMAKVFDYEIKGIRAFFERKANKFSDLYYGCNHVWSIRNFIEERQERANQTSKHLAFFLCCENNYEGLCCKVHIELRLLRQAPGLENRTRSFEYVYTRKNGHGTSFFIDEKQLFDEHAGWVRNDTIKLQVHLKMKN